MALRALHSECVRGPRGQTPNRCATRIMTVKKVGVLNILGSFRFRTRAVSTCLLAARSAGSSLEPVLGLQPPELRCKAYWVLPGRNARQAQGLVRGAMQWTSRANSPGDTNNAARVEASQLTSISRRAGAKPDETSTSPLVHRSQAALFEAQVALDCPRSSGRRK